MGQKVLLADDSITVQKIVKLSLHEEDIEVIAFGNGAQALEEIEEIRPDLVMADVFMPGKDGYEVCEFVKAHPGMNHVPVILLVHAFEPFDPERAKAVGADLQLTKPFQSIRTLTSGVKDLLAKSAELSSRYQAVTEQPAPEMAVDSPPATLQPITQPASILADETHPESEGDAASMASGTVSGFSTDDPSGFALLPVSANGEMLSYNGLPSFEPQEDPMPANDMLPPAYESYAAEMQESVEFQLDAAPATGDEVLDIPEGPAPSELMSFELTLPAEEELPVTTSFAAFEPPGDIPVINPGFDLGSGVQETTGIEVTAAPQDTDSGVQFSTVNPDEAMIQEIVNRVMERLSTKAIQDIAWEIVPEMAEMMIRKQISKQPQLSH